ncbi:MAG: uracil phosphoribosyltransferase [Akkermansiaceae bacterium]
MSDLSQHPVVADRLARLRAVDCPPQEFRRHVSEIASLLVLPATEKLGSQPVSVTTPLTETRGLKLNRPIVLVPILRAGLGLSDAFLNLLPEAVVAHYGMARNEETLEPEVYFQKFPDDLEKSDVIVLDPMLATGGSASAAITGLKDRGARHLSFVCLVASPQGVETLNKEHPDVSMTCAALDEGLNDQGYIVPGLGDAGDRIFGTS